MSHNYYLHSTVSYGTGSTMLAHSYYLKRFSCLAKSEPCHNCSQPVHIKFYHRFECDHIYCSRCIKTANAVDKKDFIQAKCSRCDPNPTTFSKVWQTTEISNVPYYNAGKEEFKIWQKRFGSLFSAVMTCYVNFNCRILEDEDDKNTDMIIVF